MEPEKKVVGRWEREEENKNIPRTPSLENERVKKKSDAGLFFDWISMCLCVGTFYRKKNVGDKESRSLHSIFSTDCIIEQRYWKQTRRIRGTLCWTVITLGSTFDQGKLEIQRSGYLVHSHSLMNEQRSLAGVLPEAPLRTSISFAPVLLFAKEYSTVTLEYGLLAAIKVWKTREKTHPVFFSLSFSFSFEYIFVNSLVRVILLNK